MKWVIFQFIQLALIWAWESNAQVLGPDPLLEETIRIYGEPIISNNPDLLNSTSNDCGPWGSPEFLNSFKNDCGPLGSPEFLHSVSNDYGTGAPIRIMKAGGLEDSTGLEGAVELYGEPVISANPDLLNSTSNDVGPWGSPEFLYSFANDVGLLGSPDMLNSVTNEYGEGLKIRLLDAPLEAPLDLESP